MKFISLITFSQAWSKIWPILIAILFFGLIIFIHELGHFIFAKAFGVKVNEFALGMGPTLIKKKIGETVYALRLFPIGGFVEMEGENDDSNDSRAFCNKKLWQRMIIVLAGAFMNILLGVIICGCFVSSGELVGTNQVNQFYEGAVTSATLKQGDKLLKIDGHRVFSDYDIAFLLQRNDTAKFDIEIERNNQKIDLNNVQFQRRTSGNFTYDENRHISGLSSKIKKQGLEEDDEILAVNGKRVTTSAQMLEEISKDEDKVVDFSVMRNQGKKDVKGVKMETATVLDFTIVGESKTVKNVVGGAFKYSLTMGRMVYLTLFDLLRGHYGIKDLAGPIGTVSVISDVAKESVKGGESFSQLLLMMALITINIGLFNILPIPALDGGRFFFMLVELIFRKPIPAKYENMVHAVGMILLLVFMAVISIGDILRIIKG